jgi:PTH1 family peptidyl-tRNA hydrolase
MNLSGESVIKITNFYKLEKESVLVIYDDVDLQFGNVKLKPEGSAGGQKGMNNIINRLGSNVVSRIRIGLESRGENSKFETSDFVLSKFKPQEEDSLEDMFSIIEEGIQKYYNDSIENSMNIINAINIL